MKLRLSLLFGLALTPQLVNASWHGFDPVAELLQGECDRLRLISRRLVETIRQSA